MIARHAHALESVLKFLRPWPAATGAAGAPAKSPTEVSGGRAKACPEPPERESKDEGSNGKGLGFSAYCLDPIFQTNAEKRLDRST